MRYVVIVLAVVEVRVLMIRRRSQIDIEQDLDTVEICSNIVSEEPNMTSRLRVESDGMTLEGMRIAASEILVSCLGRPISKNSVLDWLSERRLTWHPTRHSVNSSFLMRNILREAEAEEELNSWLSSSDVRTATFAAGHLFLTRHQLHDSGPAVVLGDNGVVLKFVFDWSAERCCLTDVSEMRELSRVV